MKQIPFLLVATSLFIGPSAVGAVTDEDFELLHTQLAAVSQRLDDLAAENAELKRSQADNTTAVADIQTSVVRIQDAGNVSAAEAWTDRIRMDGDFRYRYETIDVDSASIRSRNRISARANVRADLADDVEIGFGLATGGDDPVSTNQTIGGGGSSKNVALNLAYADWAVTDNLHLIAGKYKNPMFAVGKQPMLFDSDWTPEGMALTYKHDWFFANAFGNWLESDSRNSNDTFSWGGQLGATGEFVRSRCVSLICNVGAAFLPLPHISSPISTSTAYRSSGGCSHFCCPRRRRSR